MKITQFDDKYTQRLGQGTTTLVSGTSGGSNSSLGGDVSGTLGNVSVNGLRRSVSLGSNLGTGVAVGDTLTIISTAGTPVARFATPSNTGSASFGSNATRVSKNSSVGALSTSAREDHIHDGIGTITASSSNTAGRGTFNLRAGNNVSIGWTDTDGDGLLDTATLHASVPAGSGGGVTSIAKSGSAALTGAVTLTGGTNVTLTQSGQDISIASTGGGGSTILYGTLKPGSPTDDFSASTLNVAWSAHATRGSFTTSSIYTQALDGSHVSLGYMDYHGTIWRSTTNVDQEFLAGGLVPTMLGSTDYMYGIAILDSAGTGVAIVSYNDGNAYLATITTWTYTSFTGNIALFSHGTGQALGPLAMRLVRAGNVFTGYVSSDGSAWYSSTAGSFNSTLTKTITADRVVIGTFYNPATSYQGRLYCDWAHKI